MKRVNEAEEIKQERKKVWVISIFVLWGIILVMQHRLIGMYFDDFGNASLSYGIDSSSIAGTDYTFKDLMNWAKFIYYNWGGRILYALIMIPMMKNSVFPFMLFQAVILLGIFIVMYKIVKRYCQFSHEPVVVAGLILMYGLLSGTVVNWGLYWASASVLYLLPILPFLLCTEVYNKAEMNINQNNVMSGKYYIYLAVLIPLITLSQEQVGGGFLVWVIFRILFSHIKEEKKYLKLDLFMLIWSLITFLIFFCAPGNWARLDSNTEFAELSLLEKMQHNLPTLVYVLDESGFFYINILLWLSGICMLWMLAKKKKNWAQLVLLLGILPYGFRLFNIEMIRMFGQSIPDFGISQMTFILFLFSMFFIMLMFFYERKHLDFMALMIAAVASVGCLLISPSMATRSCIPYIFVCMIFVGIVGYTFWCENRNLVLRITCIVVVCLFAGKSVVNLCKIYQGYEENYYAEKYNFEKLKNYDGVDKTIGLLKYKNDIYRAPAPYDEGFEFCEYWMREYFDIPMDVEFVWISLDDMLELVNHGN